PPLSARPLRPAITAAAPSTTAAPTRHTTGPAIRTNRLSYPLTPYSHIHTVPSSSRAYRVSVANSASSRVTVSSSATRPGGGGTSPRNTGSPSRSKSLLISIGSVTGSQQASLAARPR